MEFQICCLSPCDYMDFPLVVPVSNHMLKVVRFIVKSPWCKWLGGELVRQGVGVVELMGENGINIDFVLMNQHGRDGLKVLLLCSL